MKKIMTGLQTSSSAQKSGSVILTLIKRLEAVSTFKRLEAVSTLPALLAAMFLLFSLPLLVQTIAKQDFENDANDTWAYTANPAGTVPNQCSRTGIRRLRFG